MTGVGLKKEFDLVAAYRRALLGLLEQCKDVAEGMNLTFDHGEADQAAFGMQQTDDEGMRAKFPNWQVSGGEILVRFTPDDMQQDFTTGLHFGLVSVERFRNQGRMDCPTA